MTTVVPDKRDLKGLRLLAQRSTSWFVVLVRPQGERQAAKDLRRHGLRVYVPKRYREVMRRKRKAVRNRPLMRGYLFVRFRLGQASAARLFAIAHLSGAVHDVLWFDVAGERVPYPLPDKDVQDFIDRQRNRREFGRPFVETEEAMLARQRTTFEPGSRMRVASGPLSGREAVVDRFGGLNDVDVLVELLGRSTRVTLSNPEQELEPLPESAAAA